MTLTVSKQHTD